MVIDIENDTNSSQEPGLSISPDLSISREFKARLAKALDIISNCTDPIRVLSHYDGDGISAAGVLSNALHRNKLKFHTTMIRSLNREKLEKLCEEQNDVLILMDFGSAQIDDVEKLLVDGQKTKVIILDHHKPLRDSDKVVLLNCHLFGIDGTYDACAATMAFILAIAMTPNNWDLADLAVGGTIADKQHLMGFKGLNSEILIAARNKGIIESKLGFKFHGPTLQEALKVSVDPFFIGLSGREDEISKLLEQLELRTDNDQEPEVEAASKLESLTELQIKVIGSFLALKLLQQGVRSEFVERVVTERYWSPARNIDIEELSGYINACGRMDRMGLGLALCMFDQTAFEESMAIRVHHKRKIMEGLISLEKNGCKFLGNIQYFHTSETALAGTFAGLGMIYMFDPEKPVFALSERDEKLKISARGTTYLIDKGLDLAIALRTAAEAVNGVGGGHSIAAGATIPKNSEQEFLAVLDRIVGQQMNK